MTEHFGKILKFESNKVVGIDTKPKYHLVLCISDRSFLFINSSSFDDSFEITKIDWTEMPNAFSSISCNSVLRYDPSYLKTLKYEACGSLSRDCITRLREHLPYCDSLATKDLNYACQIIDNYLSV